MRDTRGRSIPLLPFLAVAWFASVSAQADEGACILVAQNEPAVAQDSPRRGPSPGSERIEGLYGPVREDEIRALVRAFEPQKPSQRSTARIRGFADSGLSPDRLAVVLRDVTSLLLVLHAEDGLETLRQASKLDAQTREWMEGALGEIGKCGASGLESRGGKGVYEESLALIRKYRSPLEKHVLSAVQWGTRSAVEFPSGREGKLPGQRGDPP